MSERERARYRPADRMPGQVRFLDAHLVQKSCHNPGEEVQVALSHVLRGAAMAGHVKGVDGRSEDRASWLKTKMLMSPAKPGMKMSGVPPSPIFRYWMRRPSTSTVSCGASGYLLFWDERCLELLDEGVYLRVRDGGIGDHTHEATDRKYVTFRSDSAAQDPAAGASTTLLIFSLSTSTTSSPTSSSAPSSTSHSITVPSVIVRPHFGMPSLEIWRVSLINAPHQNRLSRERRRLCAPGRGRRGPPGR